MTKDNSNNSNDSSNNGSNDILESALNIGTDEENSLDITNNKEDTEGNGDINTISTHIETVMQKSYLEYAMSVIISRALPDCRDGLKPVHRRILYAMHDTGNYHNKPYRKSARVVGEVMGKYHPHGDAPIYGSLARMAQHFSLRAPLIDGQGNFGSIDGDPPAHMRYTEARLEKLSDHGMLMDIDKDTVDFQDNYDNSEKEPVVLPTRFLNILANGSSGIAVGMATNIPTHNIGELTDACCAYLDNELIAVQDLIKYVPGPDFPGGGEILGSNRTKIALMTGRGSIVIRGKANIEHVNKQQSIIITELPYQVNKAELISTIENLSRDKIIDGITEISDETNKLGMRIVINVRRDAEPEVILNQLYRHTQLQTSFGVNMLALKNGKPQVMNLLDFVSSFIKFREEVVTRRTQFLLNKTRDRAHLLIGLLIAVDNIDEIISLIKKSKDVIDAKNALLERRWKIGVAGPMIALIKDRRNKTEEDGAYCYFTEDQVKAILDMKLQRLTGLEHTKIVKELEELVNEIKYYMEILKSRVLLFNVIREELLEIKENFSTPRRTIITQNATDISDESLIQNEVVVITVTRGGYIKRVTLNSYKAQHRGGKGRSSMNVHEDDSIINVLITNNHDSILFFSNIGRVYRLKVYKIPQGSMQSKGRALINMLSLSENEKITNIITVHSSYNNVTSKKNGKDNDDESYEDDVNDIISKDYKDELLDKEDDKDDAVNGNDKNDDDNEDDKSNKDKLYIVFATANGNVRRNALSDFDRIPSSGKIAIKLLEEDNLIGVVLCKCDDHVLLATAQGKAVRCAVTNLRVFKGRNSSGTRGVKLSIKNDSVISISILHGIKISQEKREIYLKINDAKRIAISNAKADGEDDKVMKLISSSIIENGIDTNVLSVQEILELVLREEFILTVNNIGYGKRTSAYEYRVINRGGQGILNIKLPNKKSYVVSSFSVKPDDEVMLLTDSGTMIRTPIKQIRITSRGAIGVRIINLKDSKDKVTSVTKISIEEGAEEEGAINTTDDVINTEVNVDDNNIEVNNEIVDGVEDIN